MYLSLFISLCLSPSFSVNLHPSPPLSFLHVSPSCSAGDHPDVLRRSVLTVRASKRRIETTERNAKRQASRQEIVKRVAYFCSDVVVASQPEEKPSDRRVVKKSQGCSLLYSLLLLLSFSLFVLVVVPIVVSTPSFFA